MLRGGGKVAAQQVDNAELMENLKNREDRKLVEFSIKALEIFKSRLHEWPTKAAQLFTIENLREKYIELLEDIRYVRLNIY